MGNSNLLFENTGSHISFNGEIIDTQRYLEDVDDTGYWDGGIAYDVVRVIHGVPMFFEDHCERLNASMAKLDIKSEIGNDSLYGPITNLLDANRLSDCNIKIWAAAADVAGQAKTNIFLNINKSFYPPPEYYRDGVPTGLYAYTRDNPNVKRVVTGFKERVQALMDSGGVFEVLLYDDSQRLTEGSRTNLFFVRGDQLYTAPDRMILKGTVRKYVFEAAKRAGVNIVERPVALDEIGLSPGSLDRRRAHGGADSSRFKHDTVKIRLFRPKKAKSLPLPKLTRGPWPNDDSAAELPELAVKGAFLTGTSIGVLPISRIGGMKLDSAGDPIIRRIRDEYEKLAHDYVGARIKDRRDFDD